MHEGKKQGARGNNSGCRLCGLCPRQQVNALRLTDLLFYRDPPMAQESYFFQASKCYVPYRNVVLIEDRGTYLLVWLDQRLPGMDAVKVEGEDVEPFRTWLDEHSDGPLQRGRSGGGPIGFKFAD